ncbi:hypothetical protein F5879DRAFT_966547 [Lentinula edodes]|nr:hypothetical protein F5879DRAFT_966547 [Lentinula edodes]
MNLLQRIIQLFRKLYNSQPAQLALRSVLALYTFLVRQGRKRTLKKRKLSARPDFDEKNVASEPPPSSIPAISATICASRTPAKDTLYPYPFSGTNASVSSQDVSASSVHTDVNTQRSYRRSLGISHPHQTRHLDPRSRSNPHIDIPAISGQHAHLISMVNYLYLDLSVLIQVGMVLGLKFHFLVSPSIGVLTRPDLIQSPCKRPPSRKKFRSQYLKLAS